MHEAYNVPMGEDRKPKQRKAMRLAGYDYSLAGAYFVTICCHQRKPLFGTVADGEMRTNAAGEMIAITWKGLVQQFSGVAMDEWVVMPNHFHGIVWLQEHSVGDALVASQNRAGTSPAPTNKVSLVEVMAAFKSLTTNAYIQSVKDLGWLSFDARLWQRSFYDRIIRNERELDALREYIVANPLNWDKDEYHSTG